MLLVAPRIVNSVSCVTISYEFMFIFCEISWTRFVVPFPESGSTIPA